MQLTYNNLPADALNDEFWKTIQARFAGKHVSITVEENEPAQPQAQLAAFHTMEKLRKKLSKVKVDPQIDLSALANDVNL